MRKKPEQAAEFICARVVEMIKEASAAGLHEVVRSLELVKAEYERHLSEPARKTAQRGL